MKTCDPSNRMRPSVVGLLIFLPSAFMILIWLIRTNMDAKLNGQPTPGIEAPSTAAAPAKPQAAKKAAWKSVDWHRVTPAPRGAPASILASVRKPNPGPLPSTNAPSLEERWGIQVCGMSLAMGNAMVHLRYKVIDPNKVAPLATGVTWAYIYDPATKARLYMLTPPKEGAFPATGNRLTAGKTYFAMVGNKGGVLKSGSKVSVIVGNSLASNITIE